MGFTQGPFVHDNGSSKALRNPALRKQCKLWQADLVANILKTLAAVVLNFSVSFTD